MGVATLAVVFGNRVIRRPGVYTSVNPTGLAPVVGGASNSLALVGTSLGTLPQTVQVWSDSLSALALRGGDLLNAVNFAFNPGGGLGATSIYTVRVNAATPASATLVGANGAGTILLTAADAGTWTNSIQALVTKGATANTVDVSIQYTPDNYQVTSPDLGQALQVTYTGNATSAVATLTDSLSAPLQPTLTTGTTGALTSGTVVWVEVTAVNASGESLPSPASLVTVQTATGSVTASWAVVSGASSYNIYATASGQGNEVLVGNSTTLSFTITTAPPATGAAPPTTNTTGADLVVTLQGQTDGSSSLDWNLALTPYMTVQALSASLNQQVGYTATVLGTNIGTMPSAYIDPAYGVNLIGPNGGTFTANQGSVIYWINSQAGGYVTASAIAGSSAAPAPTTGWLSLTGGSEGPTPTLADWQAALALLEKVNCSIVVPLTDDAAIQSVFNAENVSLANRGIAFRTGMYGGALGETASQSVARAQGLNSKRAVLAAPGFYQNDYNGNYTEFPPYMLAALYGGIAAGLPVATPLTYKTLNVLQLEQSFNDTTLGNLVNSGVAPASVVRSGGFRIEQGVTTEAGGTIYNVEYSVLRSVDFLREGLIPVLTQFIGDNSQGSITAAELMVQVNSFLSGQVQAGIIASFTPLTTVAASAQSVTALLVPIQVDVLDPINDILVTINLG